MRKIASLCGWDVKESDGFMAPGGTNAILTAFIVGRHFAFPHVKTKGWLPSDKPVAFCSAQAHYAFPRAVMLSGMGTD